MSTVQCKCKNPKCGGMFEARVADRKRGWARYCSKSCKAQHQESRTGQYKELMQRGSIRPALCFPSHAEGEVQS